MNLCHSYYIMFSIAAISIVLMLQAAATKNITCILILTAPVSLINNADQNRQNLL